MSPIDRQHLVEIEYPKAIRNLTDALNQDVKWNFIVRYFAKEAMTNTNENTFFEWIRTPTQLFEEIPTDKEGSFKVPNSVSTCFARVHELARDILLPSHTQTETYKQNLIDGFKNAKIDCLEDPLENAYEFLQN